MKLFSPDFLSSLAKFANVLVVAAFEMVWHEALADVLEKGKVNIAGDDHDYVLCMFLFLFHCCCNEQHSEFSYNIVAKQTLSHFLWIFSCIVCCMHYISLYQ